MLDGRVYELGELPAQQSKTVSLTRDQGTAVEEFARQFANQFRSAVQARHNTFGNNAVNIPDAASRRNGRVIFVIQARMNREPIWGWDNPWAF